MFKKLVKIGRSYRLKIAIYFILFLSIVIVVFSILSFFILSNIVIRFVNSTVMDKLYQTSYSADFLLDSSKAMISQLYFDSATTTMMYSPDLSDNTILVEFKSKLRRATRIMRLHTSYQD